MSRTRGVAISGLGVIAPSSIGRHALVEQLRAGRSGITVVERFDTTLYRAKSAGLVIDFKPREFINPAKMRRMNMLSRFGVSAAKLALDDARFEPGSYGRGEVGVAIGTAFGPVQTSLDYMDEYVLRGPSLAPPQLFAESVANAPGSHIAIEHGFEGFNITFTQRESSAAVALVWAAQQVVKGSVRAALVGGVDEMNDMTFSVLDRLGALAHVDGTHDGSMRPLDAARNGYLPGEGSAAFFLQQEQAAAAPLCFVRGFAIGRDTTATVSDWGHDESAVVRVMRDALADAALAPTELSAIWLSANGGVRGDLLEARAVRSMFGASVPLLVATKGYFGEYAAGGALQLASAALALSEQFIPQSVGLLEEIEQLSAAAASQKSGLDHILVNTISAGGGIVSIVLSRSLD